MNVLYFYFKSINVIRQTCSVFSVSVMLHRGKGCTTWVQYGSTEDNLQSTRKWIKIPDDSGGFFLLVFTFN